ncbi:phage tail protein [Escherichia coli]|uniref:phage tail protein n=1 Tax=Escherichia coli TaxID=562 RepID=UPI001F05A39C|nr:phage tail protein [Escherichia coli]MCH0685639.1 phage tail protein [Escherichia coli]MDZ8664458.1 phage tail protein [Escherichia coli]WRX87722.1 phage tail protein [Escherichia coli]
MNITVEMLVDYNLLNTHGRQWKYRYSVGSGWLSSSSQEKAIEGAREAYLKAKPGELKTRNQRWDAANEEDLQKSESMWGHLSMQELMALFDRMGSDVASLRASASREFNSNGGRRTSCAVSASGSRESAEMRMKLNRYIAFRQEHAA